MTSPAANVARLLDREGTTISWAGLTFNPWIGCTKVGPACDHCYAEGLATSRLGVAWGRGAPRRRTAPGNWQKPLRWNKIAAEAGVVLDVFSASLADIFDNEVDDQWRADLAAIIAATPNLRWMLLTKRISNVAAMLRQMFPAGVPANVALGLTIANQQEADRDLPRAISVKHGLGIALLFISAEPLLGPLDLSRYLAHIDLLIAGGESGPKARPSHPGWFRSLRDQCRRSNARFHFKQWGEWDEDPLASPDDWVRPPDENMRNGLATILPDGTTMGRGYFPRDARGAAQMRRTGVKRAGHRLDGREHREHFK